VTTGLVRRDKLVESGGASCGSGQGELQILDFLGCGVTKLPFRIPLEKITQGFHAALLLSKLQSELSEEQAITDATTVANNKLRIPRQRVVRFIVFKVIPIKILVGRKREAATVTRR